MAASCEGEPCSCRESHDAPSREDQSKTPSAVTPDNKAKPSSVATRPSKLTGPVGAICRSHCRAGLVGRVMATITTRPMISPSTAAAKIHRLETSGELSEVGISTTASGSRAMPLGPVGAIMHPI